MNTPNGILYGVLCGVLGNPSTGEFRLVDVSNGESPVTADEHAKMRERGMYFVGEVGYVDGRIDATCDYPDRPQDKALMLTACLEFSRYEADRLRPKGDGSGWVEWLESLYRLPDARSN